MKMFFLKVLVINVLFCFFCNAQIEKKANYFFPKIKIDTLFQDKISIRSLIGDRETIWFAADQNRFGTYNLKTNQINIYRVDQDSHHQAEFRSCALTANKFYILSIASPALLYAIDKQTQKPIVSYQNNGKDVFFDSMQFWNSKEGIAFGDPIDGFFTVIITRNGGESWEKVEQLPVFKSFEGEGAFAASNTNIVIQKKHTWMVTGGKKARVFYSSNKGKTWKAVESPIVQGQVMTGIYSAAFYNKNIGCIGGGNYDLPNQNFGNKAMTNDGGKTWNLVSENSGPGYISCVQFVPKSAGKQLMTVGATGIHFSSDGGQHWVQMSTDPSLYTLRFIDSKTAIAAGKNKMIRITIQK